MGSRLSLRVECSDELRHRYNRAILGLIETFERHQELVDSLMRNQGWPKNIPLQDTADYCAIYIH